MPFTVTGASFYDDQSVETNAVGASTVPVASPIDLQFSQNVSTSSLLSYAVSVLRTLADGGSETPVDITLSQQDDSEGNPTIVRVTPTEDLLSTAYYTLYVPKSSYGITSGNGDPLSQSFSFSFQTVVGESVPPEVPIGENVNQLEPIPEELFLLSSSPTTLAVFQYGYGSVIAKFNGRLPADAVVLVTAKHPLGYGLVTSSLWADNMKDPIVIGSEIFLSSEIAASSVDAELLAVAGEDALTADSILVLDTSADPLTLDFDINTVFDITIEIEGNDVNPSFDFMGILVPLFATLEETKLEIGPFAEQYNDFTLALSLYRHSITAEQLWPGTMPANAPLRVAEYVIARTKRDILQTYFTDPSGVGAGTLALGDLRLSGKNLVQYLRDSLSALDMKIVALERKLKQGDASLSPYTDYTHASLPAQSSSAVFGESPGGDFESRGLERSLLNKNKG